MCYNLLLENASGGTLADFIKKHRGVGLPEDEARQYAWFILWGIHHVHKNRYVHCNIRPENIVLVPYVTRQSQFMLIPKTANFGLTKRAYSNKRLPPVSSKREMPCMAPEVVKANQQEPPSDIWAFGCVVYEMLTGVSPRSSKVAGGSIPKISRVTSVSGQSFLSKCFRRNDLSRFTAEGLFREDFVSALDSQLQGFEESMCDEMLGSNEACDEGSSLESKAGSHFRRRTDYR
ncbi:hypothetical protein MLD38_031570 [Melastoma candidum]|uniref:Uncharacterized protein n=1 Tax=Melastoma candidum TaxID=119954 RepID=A0ACB9MRL9_9MYRT|nr:hypothetical protein MLD38_031570 [Melastoma candidum]